MQAAFLAFVKDALAFESTLPQDSDAEEAEDSSSDSHDGSDEEWATTSGSEHGGRDVEEEDLDDLLPNSAHRINTAGMYRMTPQSESSIEDDFGAAIASTDASLPCAQILGDASSGSQLPTPRTDDASSTQYPEVFIPPAPRADDTPCIQYPQVFIPPACIQYPQVSIPPAPHAHDTSSTQYPEVVIPPAPPADDASSAQYSQVVIPPAPPTDDASSAQYSQVVIPPAPPTDDASSAQYSQVVIPPAPRADVENMVTPNESDGASAAPTSSVQAGSQRHRGRRTQQRSQLTVPTSSADEIQPLPDGHRRVRKPFNARERDNDIGGPTKRARHT
ncbi:uncharacterized protein F5891DRAFT_1061675 [Suillus fuscotomentosus]|uniref:Uncharacterized protein n=1 Tax=Suillus fuscotomentosus TaxID=1912939 RepID=A0AAD4DVB5_9AGAM|nr:uncharacterized protein F5891DRAFT_1061675 [Suillus fuscotomentosus]KAG1894683.1 hypothetical protein F5891DRAFT_1061675 [Suillus fuscotomentosus]